MTARGSALIMVLASALPAVADGPFDARRIGPHRDRQLDFALYLYWNNLPPFQPRLPFYFRGYHPYGNLVFRWPYNYGQEWPTTPLGTGLPEDARRAKPEPEAAPDPAEAAELRLSVTPGDATVYIDGRYYGAAGDNPKVSLAPGRHTLALVREAYAVEERALDLKPRETSDLALALRKR